MAAPAAAAQGAAAPAPAALAALAHAWSKLSPTVLVVLSIFAFVWYVTIADVALPWLEHSVWGVLNVGLLTWHAALGLLAYLGAVLTDPGSVPEGWEPDPERAVVEVKRKGSGAPRFCAKCSAHKPPRAHHCRVCRRCVLRMDHHCVWLNNCVGHRNYKAFFLFLLFAWLALAHALGLQLVYVLDHANRRHTRHNALRRSRQAAVAAALADAAAAGAPRPGRVRVGVSPGQAVLQLSCTIVTAPLVVSVGLLLAWHVYLLVHNKTTIEYHEGVRARAREVGEAGEAPAGDGAKQPAQQNELDVGPADPSHPYDHGLCNNLHHVLGQQPLLWCVPSCSAAGDGLDYPVHAGAVIPPQTPPAGAG